MEIEAAFRAAPSFDAALDLLAEHAAQLGFDAVDYAYMPRARRDDGGWHAPSIRARNFPPRWDEGWVRYAARDPYLCTCYQRTLPLDWNVVKGAAWLSSMQRNAIAYIDGLGFLDGITVPIHAPGGGFAFVSGLARPRCGAWRAHEAAMQEKLFVLAHAFHAALGPHGTAPTPTARLTPRECEVLRHAAAGRSAPATARHVHRSVETIRKQRKSAIEKLGAHTLPQAVARALALDLLEPEPG
ncbi:MAG: LuxR family transcriptional regulator [Gammaproteobacteria bacterium]|nr:LuxR family transcriptional regulator [Gammaproteobacteria bacterium]